VSHAHPERYRPGRSLTCSRSAFRDPDGNVFELQQVLDRLN